LSPGTRFSEAFHIPNEAQVDNRELLKAVAIALEEAGVECHSETFIGDGTLPAAGIVVDCRGTGAKREVRFWEVSSVLTPGQSDHGSN
jgi:glycine oxidase